mgnify:CR=1 FL=1
MLGDPTQISLWDEFKRWYLETRINRIIRYFNKILDVELTKVSLDDEKKKFILEFVKNNRSYIILTVSNLNRIKWEYSYEMSSQGFSSRMSADSYKSFPSLILKIL